MSKQVKIKKNKLMNMENMVKAFDLFIDYLEVIQGVNIKNEIDMKTNDIIISFLTYNKKDLKWEKKPKKEKDVNKPKKSRNAYIIFSVARRKEIKEEGKLTNPKDITKLIGEEWREMSEKKKEKYKKEAEKEKELYFKNKDNIDVINDIKETFNEWHYDDLNNTINGRIEKAKLESLLEKIIDSDEDYIDISISINKEDIIFLYIVDGEEINHKIKKNTKLYKKLQKILNYLKE